MTNPTQPIEHYTLEQVEQLAGWYREIQGERYIFTAAKLHALLNAAINDIIGNPVKSVCGMESDVGSTHMTPAEDYYSIKEPKP